MRLFHKPIKGVAGDGPYGEAARLRIIEQAEPHAALLRAKTSHGAALSENDINTGTYKYVMLYLLAFGNPYLNEDNLALKIADSILEDRIPELEVIKCLSPEEVLNYTDKDFFILDVVKDIDRVMVIDNIDQLKGGGLISLHDFDLGFFLKLMKETGKIEKVKIIGIPQSGDIEIIKKKVIDILTV